MENLFWKTLSPRKLVKKYLAHQTSNQLPLLVYFQNDSRHKSVQFYEVNKEKSWPQAAEPLALELALHCAFIYSDCHCAHLYLLILVGSLYHFPHAYFVLAAI